MASQSAPKGLEFEWHSFLGKLAEIASLRTRNHAGWDWATEIEVSVMIMACRKAGYHPSAIPQNFKQAVAIGPVAHQYSRIARIVLLVAGQKEIAKTWEAADAKLHPARKRQILLAEGADAILAKIMQTATQGQQDVAKQGARERLPLPGIGSEHVLEGLMQQFEELSVMCGPLAGSEPMEEDGREDEQDKKRRRMEIPEPAVPSTPSLAVATPIAGGAGAGTAGKAGRVVESDGEDDGEDGLNDDDWADGGWFPAADAGPAAAPGTAEEGGDAAVSDDLLGSNSSGGGPRSTIGGFGSGFSMGGSFDEAVRADEMRESIRAVLRLREPEDVARPKALASGSGGAPADGPPGSGGVGQSGAGAGAAAEGEGATAPQVDVEAQEAARVRREAEQKEAEARAAREAARMQRKAEESDAEDEYDDDEEDMYE